MLLIKIFSLPLNTSVLWVSIIFTFLVRGILMLSSLDLRMLLVVSSIGNNSWLVMSQISNFTVFVSYFLVYTVSVLIILHLFGSLSNYTDTPTNLQYPLRAMVMALSGLPPLPIFFFKVLIILRLLTEVGANSLLVMVIFRRAFVFISYLSSMIKYFVYSYASPLSSFISS